jgi:cytochrome c
MTDRFNTIAGWTLFAGIVALGLSSISSRIFHADNPESPEEPGYFIEGAEEEAGEGGGPPLALLLNQGDPAAGQSVFAKCTACHSIEQGGPNGIGPNLWGVMGKPIGQHAAGFAYSDALSGKGGEWTFDEMSAWLASPRAYAPGTKMSFAGLSSPEDRANVILYMLQNGGGPALPEPPAAEPAEGEGGEANAAAPDAGPGTVEGEEPTPAEAAGAMGDSVPPAQRNAAPAQGSNAGD